jgi:phosphate transport system substrate-binding protein
VKQPLKKPVTPLLLAGFLVLAILAAGCTGGKAPESTPVPQTTPAVPATTTVQPVATTPAQAAVATTPAVTTVQPTPAGTYPVQQIAGKLKVTGSTTVLPIAQAAADAYMEKNLKADVQISGGGSSVGVQAIGEGTADIGMSSREISAAEKTKYPALVPTVVATDAVVVIVHPSNPVSSMTGDQIRGLYNGTFQGWDAVGGTLTYPVIIGRDSASGTRVYFNEHVMKNEKYRPDMREMNSNGAVKQTVSQTPGAVGYVGLGYVDSSVKAIQVVSKGQAVAPTLENVLSNKYPISRPLYMITKGEPTGLAKDYLDFILSTEGQKIVSEQGFVPVS